jgi:hypothetical protein
VEVTSSGTINSHKEERPPLPAALLLIRNRARKICSNVLGGAECLQIRYATETLDLIEEVIDHCLQALIFPCQLNDRDMKR